MFRPIYLLGGAMIDIIHSLTAEQLAERRVIINIISMIILKMFGRFVLSFPIPKLSARTITQAYNQP